MLSDDLFLCSTHVEASGSHAFTHAAFFHKFAVTLLQEAGHSFVNHVTNADRGICHLLVGPSGKEMFIVCQVIVRAAKFKQIVKALAQVLIRVLVIASFRPIVQTMLLQVILIIFQQFLITAFGDAKQFNLNFE